MIDREFIVNLKGKDYVVYAGVLDAATKAGLKHLSTHLEQLIAVDRGYMAVVKARAEFEDGRVFEDYGDASPFNCSPQIATAAIRMASTRAKGRVLRDAINLGQTLLEELPDEDALQRAAGNGASSAAGAPPRQSTQSRPMPSPPPAAARPAGGNTGRKGGPAAVCSCGKPMTQKMIDDAQRAVKLTVCPACVRALLAEPQAA